MESETKEQQELRETELRRECEAIGLSVDGSLVTAHIGDKRLIIDASALDHSRIVAALIHQAYQMGKDHVANKSN